MVAKQRHPAEGTEAETATDTEVEEPAAEPEV
jgi:hypothetical protein